MMKQPELGKKIAELRKAKGLTQEELVEKCNLSVRTLQRIESGDVTPRSYTLKIIFAALDYTGNHLSENSAGRFRSNESAGSQRPGQFYRYVIDLFNLKTDTMKKISILMVLNLFIVLGVFTLSSRSQGIKEEHNLNMASQKDSASVTGSSMVFSNFSCGGCFDDNGEMFGRDVKFKNNGITVNVRLIKLNKKTREFRSFVSGKFLVRKVEVTCSQDVLNDGLVKYSADKIEASGDKILLKGSAKLTSAQNESIEAEEIVIKRI